RRFLLRHGIVSLRFASTPTFASSKGQRACQAVKRKGSGGLGIRRAFRSTSGVKELLRRLQSRDEVVTPWPNRTSERVFAELTRAFHDPVDGNRDFCFGLDALDW